jgi:hypothetical protein
MTVFKSQDTILDKEDSRLPLDENLRRQYVPPVLTSFGAFSDLTRGNPSGKNTDTQLAFS